MYEKLFIDVTQNEARYSRRARPTFGSEEPRIPEFLECSDRLLFP